MLYYLSEWAAQEEGLGFLRLFKYVTFRAGGAAVTAFLIMLIFGPMTVRILTRLQLTAPDHLDGVVPEELRDGRKAEVPTMGGILIVSAIVASILLWALSMASAGVCSAARASFTCRAY